jgi:hypothetical protein
MDRGEERRGEERRDDIVLGFFLVRGRMND